MAQTILTNALRDQIIANALTKAGIQDKKNQLRIDRADWAERVRLKAIGGVQVDSEIAKAEKKIKAIAEKLPEPLQSPNEMPIRKSHEIRLNLAGSRSYAFFNGNRSEYERGAPDHIWKVTPRELTLTADNPLVDEFYTFDQRQQEIDELQVDVKANVNAALQKVRTVKRLLEEWPEAAELLPPDAPKIPPVPAVRREALNEMLGLPTDEKSK